MFLLGGVFGKLIPFLMHGTNALIRSGALAPWLTDVPQAEGGTKWFPFGSK